MARETSDPVLSGVTGGRVDALARQVISNLRSKPSKELRARVEEATGWLVEEALTRRIFILEDVRSDLRGRDLTAAEIIDHCIPNAAREMGQRWVDDVATFSEVSLGSARLHGLCKLLSARWDNTENLKPNGSVLIAVCDREDHLIGPVVLADQVRRAGYSVHLMVGAAPDKLLSKLTSEPFSTVLISCSGSVAVEPVASLVDHVRRNLTTAPRFVLGGPVVEHLDGLLEKTGVDLVTNSVGLALAGPDADIDEIAVSGQ